MTRLLHFSDIHIQLPRWRTRPLRTLGPLRALATVELWKGRGKYYDDALDKLRVLRRAIDEEKADHAVFTGDVSQLGCEEEFALAAEVLAPLLPERLTCIAGNHDRYPIGGRPPALFERYFPGQPGSDLPSSPLPVRLVGEDVALVSLDSCGALCWPVLTKGHMRKNELKRIAPTLALPELRGRCKLLLVHHAPTDRGQRQDWPRGPLFGASALMKAAATAGADAILCGHIHQRFDDPPRPGRPRIICAGSSTELGREGYWVLEIEGGKIASARMRSLNLSRVHPERHQGGEAP